MTTNRIGNELSHLEEIFDRRIKPVDIPELADTVKFVLVMNRRKGRKQYDSLVRRIGELPQGMI